MELRQRNDLERPGMTGLSRICTALCLALMVGMSGCGVDDAGRLERAAAAFESGDYRAAAIDARAVLKNNSNNLDARLLLAKASFELGDGASAEKEFRRALELGADREEIQLALAESVMMQRNYESLLDEFSPDDFPQADRPTVYLLRGSAQRALGDRDAAVASLEQAVRLDPTLVDARSTLVGIAMDDGDLRNAGMMLERLQQDAPEDMGVWLLAGRYQLVRQDLQAARRAFDEALTIARTESDPKAVIAPLNGLFDIYLNDGEVDAARAALDELRALAPEVPTTMVRAARIEFLEENWEEAKTLLQQALQVSDSPVAKEMLGFVHYKLGEYAQADMMLSSVVEPGQSRAESLLVLADVRRRLDRPEPLMETLAPIIEASDDPIALSSALQITFASGALEDSVLAAERAVERFPDNALLQLDLATAYAVSGRLREADEVLARIETGGPATLELRRDILFAWTQFGAGDMDAAAAAAARLVDSYPGESTAVTVAGDIAYRQGNYELAGQRFSAAAELSPEDSMPLKNLARVAAQQRNFDEAASYLDRALKLAPTDIGTMVARSQLDLITGDRDGALEWLRKARDTDPDAAWVARRLARMQLQAGDAVAARNTVATGMQRAPNDTGLAMLRGEISLVTGDLEAAEEQFGAVIGMDESLPDGYRGLASAYLAADKPDQARTVLRRAERRGANDMRTDMMLAMMAVSDGDFAIARRLVEARRSEDPAVDLTYVVEGELLLAQGDARGAAASFERAWQRRRSWQTAARHAVARVTGGIADPMALARAYSEDSPEHVPSKVFLAQGYQQLGDHEAAIPYFRRAIELSPGNAALLNNFAWTLSEVGDEAAVDYARQARAADERNPAIADTLGWILARRGESAEALPLLEQAHEQLPENAEIAWHLAYVLSETGDIARARRLLDYALGGSESFPGRDDAAALRARLET